MNKYVKGTMLVGVGFIGGTMYSGIKLINYALNNEYIRKGMSDAIANKLDEVLWSDKPIRRDVNPVSYRRYCEERYVKPYSDIEIAYGTREEADKILDEMTTLVKEYGQVTVGDMYELSNMSSRYSNYAYGWTNLDGVSVISEAEGYFIELPDPIKIYK